MPEDVPNETETIAAKRAFRIAEKLKDQALRPRKSLVWWNSSIVEAILVVFIVILNFYTVLPQWNHQTSYNTFYSGPVIPFLAKLLEFFGVKLTSAFQYVNIVFYSLLPVGLYLFIKSVTDRKIIAFLAVVIASLPLFPFSGTRVNGMLFGVDGAHISSLPLILIALIGLLLFLRQGGSKYLIFASIFSALIALISPFGFMNYSIFAFILTFSEMLLGDGRLKFFRFLGVILFAGSLIAFWYNPSFTFWMFTGFMGAEVRTTISKLIPISLFTLPILGTFGYLLFDRKPTLQPVFLASFFSIGFALISLVGGGVFPSHPSRYLPEFGISISILLSIVIIKLFESLPIFRDNKFLLRAFFVLMCSVLIVAIPVLGKNNLIGRDSQVLGIWDGVEKGTIWQEREKFNGFGNIAGFSVTAFGVIGLWYVSIKYKL